jgi:general secretion pathway protein E
VQFELDGLKQELQRLPLDLGQRVVTCLKTAARLNLAERRQQDGHFLVQMPGADLQCRLTTLGTLQGPRATVIIKDPRVGPRPATALGLRSSDLETLLHLLDHRGKLILVSGPSGSGKTTTLYALLSRFNPERTRLATIEEHIEHPLPHIVQTEIGPTFQMDYSTALRSLVHREPEVIMVGDVSDSQTAELALQAAEGGRLILTGVEAKDSASAVMRLRGLGVTTRRMVDTVSAIVSQRLVRVLCTQCKEPIELGDELWAWARKHGLSSRRAHRPRGCPQCRNTGFRGRTGVFELLVITPQLSACLQREPSILELRQAMAAAGSRPLLSHAMEMISAGITSCEEVQRTCVQEAET